MPRTATNDAFEVPATIAGLWGLFALVPLRSRSAYDEAGALCRRLAVRRLNAVQREYLRELTALVETYEDSRMEGSKTLAKLHRLSGM